MYRDIASEYISFDDKTSKYILFACIFHLILLVFFVISTSSLRYWFSTNSNIYKKEIKMITTAVRVDVVAMPRLTVKELRKITVDLNRVSKFPAANTDKDIVFKKTKRKSFTDLLKDLSRKKIKKTKPKKKSRVSSQGLRKGSKGKGKSKDFSNELRNLVLAGNKISKGKALVSDTVDTKGVINSEFNEYALALPDLIRPYWKLPTYLIKRKDSLKCRVRIYIGSNGKLIKTQMFESSGLKEYDSLAINSVKNASPFPRPKRSIRNNLVRGDIILGFPL